jgi:hypothetical protein
MYADTDSVAAAVLLPLEGFVFTQLANRAQPIPAVNRFIACLNKALLHDNQI